MKNETHEYQIVLKFSDNDLENYDLVIALEAKLVAELMSGEVDGHDVGGDIMNIFIITSEPIQCFEETMRIIKDNYPKLDAAGYRDLEEENYVRLWPKGDLTPFELK